MIRAVRMLQHYVRAFREAVEVNGWRFALYRSAAFARGRILPRLRRRLHGRISEQPSPFSEIIGTLETAAVERPLLLIISNIQIRQCVHYRIQQKIRYLEEIGIRALHFTPAEKGRLQAFLGLAHSVLIYRTALDEDLFQQLRASGMRILFEFDDLVVGREALETSGILSQVTETQALQLRVLAEDFLNTARNCDGLIVSTPYLAELYARPENGLAEKPCFIIPNFVETDAYPPAGPKDVTFAFTSPSGSIRDELAMLKGFLAAYDAVATHDWTILVMGNNLAQKELEAAGFLHGKVLAQPFSAFEDYLHSIARAETVLIPLTDSSFNRSKTPIRLMDAAISGTQALFCPVGAYQSIQNALESDLLCVPGPGWPDAGSGIGPVLAQQEANLADLQQAVCRIYGTEAARSCYRDVFIAQMGMLSAVGVARNNGSAAP